jgi:NADH-quinone oxidoreductase subunit G
MPAALAGVARAVAGKCGRELPSELGIWAGDGEPGTAAIAIADALVQAGNEGVVMLGNLALSHPSYADLHALAQSIAAMTGARLGVLGEANTAAGWLAGCVPHRLAGGSAAPAPGANAAQMVEAPRKGYLLLGLEPALDCLQGASARKAMKEADFVVALSAFKDAVADCADVLLPLAPFSETSGSFVNCTGALQGFRGAVEPRGESRPGWKILRVLGNLLDVAGFDYTSPDEVRAEAATAVGTPSARLAPWRLAARHSDSARSEIDLERIAEVPPYLVDSLVRRAPALQATADNPAPAVRMNAGQARKSGFTEGGLAVNVHMGRAIVQLDLVIDERVPDGCILVPSGTGATAELGGPGLARVVRV